MTTTLRQHGGRHGDALSLVEALTHPDVAADAPVWVVAGHYGSGKTEFSVNLALAEAAAGHRVALADLDIVNPYFRSRDRADVLEAAGVRVISSSLGHRASLELPAVSPSVRGPLVDRGSEVILDLGGDAVGARLLAQFRGDVVARSYQLLVVVNAYRPETSTLGGVLEHLAQLERATGLRASGLVSNTHWLRQTSPDDVLGGLELCAAASAVTGVPLAFVAAVPQALDGLSDRDRATFGIAGRGSLPTRPDAPRLLSIGMYLRDEWM